MYSIHDFDYALPTELIAQQPPTERGASRLLRLAAGQLEDRRFSELAGFLDPGDVIVFNDTRVMKARLFGIKDTGGRVEVLIERVVGDREALAHIRASKSPRPGARIRLEDKIDATVVERDDDLFRLRFDVEVGAMLEAHGHVPLPPYITHSPDTNDALRYQTIYAREPGAIAAPTAGLHFDQDMLTALTRRGVEIAYLTLHVGAGTFQPVRVERIDEHRMHSERFAIPQRTARLVMDAKAAGRRIVAVGTTSLRALEASAAQYGTVTAGPAETDIFITPGFEFRVVDRLITNFHLPRSTLLMLVSAFAGIEPIRDAYRHAIAHGYRFFSYGDAMLIDRASGDPR
ncbi:MAG: tRNA preQ1(34) S-adenosylmethionine ribosyltransferase-isomerase QueA [Burkholderiales bacterium]